jgi:uncharacterized membrane protein YfcA
VNAGSELASLGLAGLGAGALNALAGGGTLITFPALTAVGLTAVVANVTNTVALCPGYVGATLAQRGDLRGQGRRLAVLLPAGVAGGALGAWILLHSEERLFRALVPWLILLATALLACQQPLRAWIARRTAAGGPRAAPGAGAASLPVGLGAVYGGYFGAGLSVVVLAALAVVLDDTLTRLNALKQALALGINVAAALVFAAAGPVDWTLAAVVAAGALIGGALGGRLARRVSAATLRWSIVVLGVVVAAAYFAA